MSTNSEHQEVAKKLAIQYTPSMQQILNQLGISLLVTTYGPCIRQWQLCSWNPVFNSFFS